MTARYIARLSGHGRTVGPTRECATIAEARRWAESYGTTADDCSIVEARTGREVARHRRDPEGDGTRWYRAVPAPSAPDDYGLVGRSELAARAGVSPATVDAWRRRHDDFPEPVMSLNGGPVWQWSDVEPWLAVERRPGRPPKT